ncbi:MAG: hypothetical protein HOC09_20350, partial [Deltaproteobacteria bacterium]|nr:hypothetical protein [Deltaproteobacteria bacterium]
IAENLGGDTSEMSAQFKQVGRKAVADGASVIVPIPSLISQLFQKEGGLTKLDGATVLNPITVSIKMAEFLVDLKSLGIEVSRTLQVGGSPSVETMAECFETYGNLINFE